MKDSYKNKEPSDIQYWGVNNVYGWAITQKLPGNKFEWIKKYISIWCKDSDKGYFLEADVQYLETLHELHNDLLFLTEKMKTEKLENLVVNLNDKTKYIIHIRNLKEASNQGLVLKQVQTVIKFNQNAWLKSYINHNTDLRKKAKKRF